MNRGFDGFFFQIEQKMQTTYLQLKMKNTMGSSIFVGLIYFWTALWPVNPSFLKSTVSGHEDLNMLCTVRTSPLKTNLREAEILMFLVVQCSRYGGGAAEGFWPHSGQMSEGEDEDVMDERVCWCGEEEQALTSDAVLWQGARRAAAGTGAVWVLMNSMLWRSLACIHGVEQWIK